MCLIKWQFLDVHAQILWWERYVERYVEIWKVCTFNISKAFCRSSKAGHLKFITGSLWGLDRTEQLVKLLKNISLFECLVSHPLFGKKHSQSPLFQLLFLSFSFLEMMIFVPCSNAAHMHPYVTPATAVCVRWRPQIFSKIPISTHPWAMQLFIFNTGKSEAKYYTLLKKAFEFLNECYIRGITNIINAYSSE